MNLQFEKKILEVTDASSFSKLETIQNLWSGYGEIVRIGLEDSDYKTVVLKHVRLPKQKKHPRGWNTNISHNRKIKSYEVESSFYKNWSAKLTSAKIPNCLAMDSLNDEVLLVLEDLDANGYPLRKHSVEWSEVELCLEWLANFHATYMGESPKGLWKVGTYWHLETRPEELEVLDDISLKNAASGIDTILNEAKFQTFVHGDAKLANFCFSEDGKKVAGLDFQYVGGGCGMKDVAYFIGSCLDESDCERLETIILKSYFKYLKEALKQNNKEIDFEALELEWRLLYKFAWTDFHRFLKGWSPGHWKINSYSEKITQEVIERLKTFKNS